MEDSPGPSFSAAISENTNCCMEPATCFKAFTGDCTAHLPPSPLDDVLFMVVFDDADRTPRIVKGYGPAKAYFRRISMSWNAHLFVKIESNSRDEKHANATLAELTAPAAKPAKPTLPFAIEELELAALHRFYECALDNEGHDVPTEMMRRLAAVGLVHRKQGSFYETTEFGLAVLSGFFDTTPSSSL